MSIYLKKENRYEVRADGAIEALKKLPEGVYYIEWDIDLNQFYLEKKTEFVLPKKVYGSQIKTAERIVNTFTTIVTNQTYLNHNSLKKVLFHPSA